MRVTLVLSIFFAGNAFAAGDERSVDPSRFDFANTAVFRSILYKVERLPSSATGHVVQKLYGSPERDIFWVRQGPHSDVDLITQSP